MNHEELSVQYHEFEKPRFPFIEFDPDLVVDFDDESDIDFEPDSKSTVK